MLLRPTEFLPGSGATLSRRNSLADWAFYDVSNLTRPEFEMLLGQTTLEGSILVVHPAGGPDTVRVAKFDDHDALRAAPGDLLTHFTIAGVGNSDVGAASLARTLANHLDTPVGAIVSGYGVADLLTDALGGWFWFGAANRATAFINEATRKMANDRLGHTPADRATIASMLDRSQSDTRTLLRLLIDPERDVKTLVGHSKGCLSIAFTLNHIAANAGPGAFAALADIEVITTGAVVEMPAAMTRLRQYVGALDWFGSMNSVPGLPSIRVPQAWHHLNTELPVHMDLSRVLAGACD